MDSRIVRALAAAWPAGSRVALLVAALVALPVASAAAEVRAWLDRDRIELGETVTLNIETDGGDGPD